MMKIAILIIGLCSILLSGCASFRDAKAYEMKKSPCACIDDMQYIEQDMIIG